MLTYSLVMLPNTVNTDIENTATSRFGLIKKVFCIMGTLKEYVFLSEC